MNLWMYGCISIRYPSTHNISALAVGGSCEKKPDVHEEYNEGNVEMNLEAVIEKRYRKTETLISNQLRDSLRSNYLANLTSNMESRTV